MAHRRRYGLWDQVALTTMLRVERRSPRFVPRLGVRRPWNERLKQWRWRMSLWTWRMLTWPLAATAIVGMVLLFRPEFLTSPAFKHGLLVWYGLVLLSIGAFLLSELVCDPRAVVMRRARLSIMRDGSTAKAASEVVQRRNIWPADLEAHRQPIRGLLARQTAWSLVVVVLPLIWGGNEVVRAFHNPLQTAGVVAAPKVFGWILWLYLPAFLIVTIAVGVVCTKAFHRLQRSLKEQVCPECEYAQPDGLIAHDERGKPVHFGPEFCSECGTPWPLVPLEPVGFVSLDAKNVAR